jgi:hypothetical protein
MNTKNAVLTGITAVGAFLSLLYLISVGNIAYDTLIVCLLTLILLFMWGKQVLQ